ncbi:hypothetical protein ATCC90586_010175 [Pythium insidiosum]|nr:hypothetical protein ATCC90586_010175 [Pythium insidiosum]
MSGGCAVTRNSAHVECAAGLALDAAASPLAAGPAASASSPKKCHRATVSPPGAHALFATPSIAAAARGVSTAATTATSTAPAAVVAAPDAALAPSSCARSVVTAIERSVLRTLAFVLYHLDRDQARHCVMSLLQWYSQLHTQLPLFAADSLDQVATSLVALSDAEFTKFWLSLAASSTPSEPDNSTAVDGISASNTDAVQDVVSVAADGRECEQRDREADATLVRRLYEQIFYRIQCLFGLPSARRSRHDGPRHTQTPLQSPDDKFDDSHFRRRKSISFGAARSPDHISLSIIADEPREDATDQQHQSITDDSAAEMTRRMHKMMHTEIPLNLFRVTVVYREDGDDTDDDDDPGRNGFVGIISPESFPPTPITRDLQTQRMHHYTITVLDHATLALRLLEANCSA